MSIRVDFHTHTFASADSITRPEQYIAFCKKKGLDRVVVTDHNTILGAAAIHEMAPDLVIIGEEIKTTKGELLAAFVSEEIPGGLAPLEVISALRSQGAFISVSHPFDEWRNGGWKIKDLMDITPLVDAVETFNARCINPQFNKAALAYARHYNIPGTAGSDAHTPREVGQGYVTLPEFRNGSELSRSIQQGIIGGQPSPIWVHFLSSYARWTKNG